MAAVFFRYLIKSDAYSSVHWTRHVLQGTRNTRPWHVELVTLYYSVHQWRRQEFCLKKGNSTWRRWKTSLTPSPVSYIDPPLCVRSQCPWNRTSPPVRPAVLPQTLAPPHQTGEEALHPHAGRAGIHFDHFKIISCLLFMKIFLWRLSLFSPLASGIQFWTKFPSQWQWPEYMALNGGLDDQFSRTQGQTIQQGIRLHQEALPTSTKIFRGVWSSLQLDIMFPTPFYKSWFSSSKFPSLAPFPLDILPHGNDITFPSSQNLSCFHNRLDKQCPQEGGGYETLCTPVLRTSEPEQSRGGYQGDRT